MAAKLPRDQFQLTTKRNKFLLKTKFNLLNQRGTKKKLMKT
jgi:hypothetical protein